MLLKSEEFRQPALTIPFTFHAHTHTHTFVRGEITHSNKRERSKIDAKSFLNGLLRWKTLAFKSHFLQRAKNCNRNKLRWIFAFPFAYFCDFSHAHEATPMNKSTSFVSQKPLLACRDSCARRSVSHTRWQALFLWCRESDKKSNTISRFI